MPAAPPFTVEPLAFTSDGLRLAGTLFLPAAAPRGALLVCHGAGSRKENHAPMAEQAAAAGLAALTFDVRGHGESEGALDPDAWHDVVAAGERLLAASGAPWLAGRGASMGGCLLLLAARARPDLFRSLVLLCPADGASLLAGLDAAGAPADADGPLELARDGYRARFDLGRLRPFLSALDLVEVGRGLPRVLLAHARDDDEVPFAHSARLAAALAPPRLFVALAKGGHRGPGRSPFLAGLTLEWALVRGSRPGPGG